MHPDTVLEPYDVRLGASHPGAPPIHEWGARVKDQLAAELEGLASATLITLAGSQYRTALRGVPWPVVVPMQGMGIGQQLAWLTGRLAA